jgi:carbon starvation protein
VAEVQGASGLDMAPKEFDRLQASTGEGNLAGKTGGAVTLAVGMAKVFSSLPGMRGLMSYWYHFVIMFEALRVNCHNGWCQ